MATFLKNLSDYDFDSVPDASGLRIAIVTSEWNNAITFALYEGARSTLLKHGVKEDNIISYVVPGAFELIHAANRIISMNGDSVDAVIVLGCVIKGDTPHFDYVCAGVTQGVAHLNATTASPVIFGLLTTDNLKQAQERSGGVHGNKGDEAAVTAIKMATMFAG